MFRHVNDEPEGKFLHTEIDNKSCFVGCICIVCHVTADIDFIFVFYDSVSAGL